ncbi:MAG TPA: hypothetical protein VFB00_02130 [Terriglobales bacterium]|nr:hypothetical protein [Terriglobales bacterium]
MQKPSKAAVIFVVLFALPFLGFGVLGAAAFLTGLGHVHTSGSRTAGALLSMVFALIGAGLMFVAVYGYIRARQDASLAEASPNSPWLWRNDWAQSRAVSVNRNVEYTWWVGAVLVSMIFVPVAANALPGLLRKSDPRAWLVMAFCAIPALLLVGAVRATLRRERYGKTYFQFDSLPFSPGGRVRGQIQLRLDAAPQHGTDLRLACIRRIIIGTGKDRSASDLVLWQDQKNVPPSALALGPDGTAIPVDFTIPQDALETNHDVQSDQVLWILEAKADVPGVDYSDKFEVPVFRTGRSFSSAAAAPASAAEAAPGFHYDPSDVAAPSNPRVVISPGLDGSTEFYFPAFRNRGRTLGLIGFTIVWTAIVFLLWNSRAPWFFAAVFALFDLMLVYGCLQMALGSTRITVGNGKIAWRQDLWGQGKTREVRFGDLKSILATVAVQQGAGTANANYMIRLHTNSGRSFNLINDIADRQEARWIVAQMEKLAGLKQDTHVELGDAFGRPFAPPPQREVLTQKT